jgi:hypothetical protein
VTSPRQVNPSTRLDLGHPRAASVLGVVAVTSSALYFTSDVIEVAQGSFSDPQLWLTLVAEAAVPFVVIGMWLVQRPCLSRLGAVSAIAYAYVFVYFTGTVVYALVEDTVDFAQLEEALNPAMTIHGAVMVAAGIGFGYAVHKARVLPRWTGVALGVGVALVALSTGLPAAVGLVGVGVRDAAFAAMGLALLRTGRTEHSKRSVPVTGRSAATAGIEPPRV